MTTATVTHNSGTNREEHEDFNFASSLDLAEFIRQYCYTFFDTDGGADIYEGRDNDRLRVNRG
jgi:hypothetical protein